MGQLVPADDLPSNLVPASDLPSAAAPAPKANPVTGTGEMAGGAANFIPAIPVAETALAAGSSMLGSALGGYAGLAGALLPGPAGQGAAVAQRVQQGLSYQPRTAAGQKMTEALGMPGELVSKVADKVGERGAQVSPGLGTVGKTSVEGLAQLLGARAGTTPKKPLTAAQQNVAGARNAGFTMTPEEMGAGMVPRTLASLAGEPRLAKLTSKKNAVVATDKAKAELGIKADAPLDLDTLAGIRKAEGERYAAARKIGQVAIDEKYLAELDALGEKYRSAAKDFPGLAKPEVEQVIAALKKEDPAIAQARAQGIKLPPGAAKAAAFDANSAIDLMGQLRESADKAFRAGDSGMGKVYRGGAQALESQLERHLEASGQQAILKDFRAARERIAKTYAVEKALVGDQVSPAGLGKQVTKRKPLTGGLKETGEFARDFDRSSQKPTSMPTGATMHDLVLTLMNALRSGGLGWDALSVGARPVAREIIASPAAQWAMDPRTNLSGPALQAVGASSALPPPQAKRP